MGFKRVTVADQSRGGAAAAAITAIALAGTPGYISTTGAVRHTARSRHIPECTGLKSTVPSTPTKRRRTVMQRWRRSFSADACTGPAAPRGGAWHCVQLAEDQVPVGFRPPRPGPLAHPLSEDTDGARCGLARGRFPLRRYFKHIVPNALKPAPTLVEHPGCCPATVGLALAGRVCRDDLPLITTFSGKEKGLARYCPRWRRRERWTRTIQLHHKKALPPGKVYRRNLGPPR